MPARKRSPAGEQEHLLRWLGGIGAATAEALAVHEDRSVRSARARLTAAASDGLLERSRPLADRPSLYTLTRAGLRAGGVSGLQQCRVSPANALHLISCAEVAAALERRYCDHRVMGERELRREERLLGGPLASASCIGAAGEAALHRPDLVLWPGASGEGLPVAVEVELAVKAPRRLASICRAWARCRLVAGVLYLAGPEAERALRRAIASADAGAQVLAVPLEALCATRGGGPAHPTSGSNSG
ncbi:MAG TPA: hypothetical protein VNZ05_10735 [Solirubrobacteraceae bacterium]|nr:hypothetical protein [Solirubrobacteraceae bacterium]